MKTIKQIQASLKRAINDQIRMSNRLEELESEGKSGLVKYEKLQNSIMDIEERMEKISSQLSDAQWDEVENSYLIDERAEYLKAWELGAGE